MTIKLNPKDTDAGYQRERSRGASIERGRNVSEGKVVEKFPRTTAGSIGPAVGDWAPSHERVEIRERGSDPHASGLFSAQGKKFVPTIRL